MGTRTRFLRWVPFQELGTPSYFPHIRDGNMIGLALRGPGTGEHSLSATV